MGSNLSASQFYCVKCGSQGIPIYRRKGRQREPGHLKKLYCLNCGCETNHAEIKLFLGDYDYETFLIEFKNGNFTEDGLRKEPYRQFRAKIRQERDKNESNVYDGGDSGQW